MGASIDTTDVWVAECSMLFGIPRPPLGRRRDIACGCGDVSNDRGGFGEFRSAFPWQKGDCGTGVERHVKVNSGK